jgi:hypothetical protein
MSPSLRRRSYLRAVGAGAGGVAATGGSRGESAAVADDDRQDFVWLNGALTGDDRIFENVLAFAERHDLAGIISAAGTTTETARKIRPILERTGEWDVPTWLASGCFRDEFGAGQLVEDEAAMAAFLDRLALLLGFNRLSAELLQ